MVETILAFWHLRLGMESFQALVETMGCWKPLVGIYVWEWNHSRHWLRPWVVGNHWLAFTLGNGIIPGIG